MVRNFQTPMNHAYNLTIEQELSNSTSFMLAYVGTAGRDLVNWRDLNACPISTLACDTSRQPFGAQFPQYNHILQLNNDAYSNYNSLQASFKVRASHSLTGQLNFTWSKSLDTGSANRGGDFLSPAQNPYNVNAGYALSNFDTPKNINFNIVYEVPVLHALPRLLGEGWQINSLFRAQNGRPFTPFFSGDSSNQGLKDSFANYDGSPLNYDFNNVNQFFNTDAFSRPAPGTLGNAGRNSLRQPGIAQLDMSIFKNFKFEERYVIQFNWSVFNVLNRTMFAANTGSVGSRDCSSPTSCTGFGTFFATPDVGLGLNPILGTGAQRNMQFGLRFTY
jgi:hypothetical protein